MEDEIENENEYQAKKFLEQVNGNDENQPQKYRKIPVPTQYREGAKILKAIVEEGKSLKELVYNNKHIVS
jgi:hypothetical protein